MCPACMASAALMAGGVITTGGLTALAGRMFHTKQGSKTKDKTQRRKNHGNDDEQDRTDQGRATS